jgi:6-phosphogluconolactonase
MKTQPDPVQPELPAVIEHDFSDRAALADALAGAVAANLGTAVADRGSAVLALSGGTTPRLFLRRLAAQPVDWSRISVTLCDERWVPPTHARSNAHLVRENLLHGAAAAARFVPLFVDAPEPDAVLAEILRRIDALPAPFDVVVLGLGLDGHTASLFPGGDRLAEALDPLGPASVLPMHAPDAGETRITLTLPVLAAARNLYLQIEGADKLVVFGRIMRAEGAMAASPLRAVMQNAAVPLDVYWSA